MPELKPLLWPPIHVDVLVSNEELNKMLRRVEEHFEEIGKTDPFFSVLTHEKYRSNQISDHTDEFFESGKHPVRALEATAARCGVKLPVGGTCLELGCGVGRITVWLAELFRQTVGTDISKSHLELAAETANRFGRTNISFVHLTRPDAIDDLPDFDLFFSVIVLQHNAPPIIHALLTHILSKLKPGGLAYFQVPTYRFGYVFRASDYLADERKLGGPEMHVIPQPDLYALFERLNCHVLEVREDGAAGGQHISNRFLVQKAPRSV